MQHGNPINIRLSLESERIYEAEARARNLPLRTYLRQQLEEGANVAGELAKLRSVVEHAGVSGHTSRAGVQDKSLLLEMLFLLRLIAQPSTVQMAQAELKRRGFDIREIEDNDEF